MTKPALYVGCEDKEDSFYYLYSIPGFSPCYKHFFNETYTFEYDVKCQLVTENGLTTRSRAPRVGYAYRDVVR